MSFEVQPKGYQGQLEESLGQKKGSEGKPEGSEGELEGSECHGTSLRAPKQAKIASEESAALG